ncbi:hypothetical protein DYQ86_22170 [Acidobacteria bacterium AB60]|nr:hypothetical protein DYQ86_22170 [Acidobacteria bacterium AB60]
MTDLFTKAANVKTTTKAWIIAIALLILVNVPFVDDHHYQPSSVAAPISSAPVAMQASSPVVASSRPRDLKAPVSSAQSGVPPASLSSVAGDYAGSVYNETAAVSANFAIKLQETGDTLSGSMTVKPPLYGSGSLEGSISGPNVAFTVTSSIGKITFVGVRSQQRIAGTYTVAQPGGGIEKGTFTLDRTSEMNRPPSGTFQGSPAPTTLPAIATPDVQVPKSIPPPVTETVTMPPTRRVVEHSDPKNYSSCLNGFSYACNKTLLTPEEAANVEASDLRRNYSSCMNGFSYACNKNLLTADEAATVKASDLRRNYSSCMNGFSYACNKALLTPEEAVAVGTSDLRRNYSSCMNGFSYACNKRLLTPEELSRVQESDLRRNYASCMSGFSYACNKALLTPEELLQVQAKDKQRQH